MMHFIAILYYKNLNENGLTGDSRTFIITCVNLSFPMLNMEPLHAMSCVMVNHISNVDNQVVKEVSMGTLL